MQAATSLIGGRPNLLKAVAVHEALARCGWHHEIIDAGCLQARDGLRLYRELGLESFIAANLPGTTPEDYFTAISHVADHLLSLLMASRPNVLIVYGDLTPSLGAAIAGTMARVPVVHVEAGLRSRDLGDVEEINRILIDARSSLLLCNSREAFSNLVGEGYPAERCVISGNTVVAALAILMKRISAPAVDVGATRYALASFHRKETLSSRERCTAILDGLRDVAKLLPIQFILYESTEDALREKGLLSRLSEIPNMTVARTQPFRDYLNLLGSAVLVITDSSGTLDEARALGKPVVILRQSTHRIHVADSVFTRLSGHDAWRIQSAAAELLDLSVQQPAASKLFDTSDQVISSLVDAFKQLSLSLPEESE